MMCLVADVAQKSILWPKAGNHPRKSGGMGIVAVHAVLAFTRTARQVPVALHSSMRAMLIVASLPRMTLRTDRLNSFEIDEAVRPQAEADCNCRHDGS
jgi:hypothetical protein